MMLLIILSFTGCTSPNHRKKETSSEPSKESIPVFEETKTTTVNTEYYSLQIPSSWDNDCFYEITDGESNNYTLSFYDKASNIEIDGGWLFSIELLTQFEEYTNYPDYDLLGSIEVYRIGSYNVIVTYPTDVQCSERTLKKYTELENEIPSILESICFKEECIFSKEPIPIEEMVTTPIASRANGNWSCAINRAESINLIIRSDGSFIVTYNSYGEVREMITGVYEIVSEDEQYQNFCFYSSDNNYSWQAKIFQTTVTDQYGTQYDGLEYVSEDGAISYYTGIKYLD